MEVRDDGRFPKSQQQELKAHLISIVWVGIQCAGRYTWFLVFLLVQLRDKRRRISGQISASLVSKTEDLQFNLTQCAKGKHMEMKWRRSASLMRRQAPGDHNWRETYLMATQGKKNTFLPRSLCLGSGDGVSCCEEKLFAKISSGVLL